MPRKPIDKTQASDGRTETFFPTYKKRKSGGVRKRFSANPPRLFSARSVCYSVRAAPCTRAPAARGSFSTRCRVMLLRQNCLICKAPFLKVYFQKFKSFLRVSKVCQPLPRKIPQGLSDSANLARPRHTPTASNSFD